MTLNKIIKRTCSFTVVVMCSLSVIACSTVPAKAPSTELEQKVDRPYSNELFQLSERARVAYVESRLLEAAQLYQRVVEQAPDNADAWFRLGNTYAQQGTFERAIHAYETSLKNNSQQPKAWFNLSTAYLLNAQSAMRHSYDQMRPNDPARALVDARLAALSALLQGRLEESNSLGIRTSQ